MSTEKALLILIVGLVFMPIGAAIIVWLCDVIESAMKRMAGNDEGKW